MLRRFWITFSDIGKPSPLNLGCGVTANTEEEAVCLVRDKVFPIFGERELSGVEVDVDVSNLDTDHVILNSGNPAAFGVWYPALQ